MRVACVLIPHFPYVLEVERTPLLKGRNLLIVSAKDHRRVVLDASPSLKGVTQGMPLEDAQARVPLAILKEADPAYYQQRYEEGLLPNSDSIYSGSRFWCAGLTMKEELLPIGGHP